MCYAAMKDRETENPRGLLCLVYDLYHKNQRVNLYISSTSVSPSLTGSPFIYTSNPFSVATRLYQYPLFFMIRFWVG